VTLAYLEAIPGGRRYPARTEAVHDSQQRAWQDEALGYSPQIESQIQPIELVVVRPADHRVDSGPDAALSWSATEEEPESPTLD
jgi:hypothetical protein